MQQLASSRFRQQRAYGIFDLLPKTKINLQVVKLELKFNYGPPIKMD